MSAGSLKKLQEARKEFSPRASRKECSPSNTQILALRHRCQTSDLQNCKIINGCFPDGLDKESALVKNLSKKSACNAGDLGLIPGLGRSLGKGMASHSSILIWKNPMNRGAWWATVHGIAKSET